MCMDRNRWRQWTEAPDAERQNCQRKKKEKKKKKNMYIFVCVCVCVCVCNNM